MRVKKGELDEREGLKRIQRAKRRVKRVNQLLHKLGSDNENTALRQRIIAVMESPVDLEGEPEELKDRDKLGIAVERLIEELNREFMVQ
jgi:hypothetical protein